MTDPDAASAAPLANPIINTPYDPPTRHFEIGPSGPTGKIIQSRRPSAKRLKTAVEAEIDAHAWATLYATDSRPSPSRQAARSQSRSSMTMATKS